MDYSLLKKGFNEMLFPKGIKCIFCDDELPITTRECVCEKCLTELLFNEKFCLKCGRLTKNKYVYCYDCNNTKWNFTKARSVFLYDEKIKDFIHRLKYNYCRYLSEYCAIFMAQLYKKIGFHADYITYVPMHKKRQKQRGYNQSQLIANELSKILNIPVADFLVKTKLTTNMSKLNKHERKHNIKDSFAINNNWKAIYNDDSHVHDVNEAPNDASVEDISNDKNEDAKLVENQFLQTIKGKNILLADDLFTTGSTSDECSRMLKGAECGDILILSFASQTLKAT